MSKELRSGNEPVFKEISIATELPARIYISGNSTGDLILLLHGYGQTAEVYSRKMAEFLEGWSVCALQAPFPVRSNSPKKGARTGYSWYAYEEMSNTFPIPIAVGVNFAVTALKSLGLSQRVQRLIGYSQGGYLAPYLGLALPSVKQVIGISCRFKDEDLAGTPMAFRLDAIHGEKDDIVDVSKARQSHERFLAQGRAGSFKVLPQVGHAFVPEFGHAVQESLRLIERSQHFHARDRDVPAGHRSHQAAAGGRRT